MDGAKRPRQRRSIRFALLGILLLTLALRIATLVAWQGSAYRDTLLLDETYYHQWADRLADGSWSSDSVYEMSPVPAYLMAGLYRVVGPRPTAVRWLNIALGVATCGLLFLAGREAGDRHTGLAAAGLAAVFEPLVLRDITVLKTSLVALLVAALMTAMLSWWHRHRGWPLLLVGLVVGLLLGIRPNAGIWVPVLVGLVAWRERARPLRALARAALLGLGLAAALAPVVLRNLSVAGTPAIASTQMGSNLFLGNSPESAEPWWPYYRPAAFASSSPVVQGSHFVIEAGRRTGQTLDAGEASSFWTRRIVDGWLESPGRAAGRLALKAVATVSSYEVADHYDAAFLADVLWPLALPLPGVASVLVLAAVGLGLARESRGRLPALLLALTYAGTLVLFFANARYRVPVAIVLMPYAAAGLVWLGRQIAARRWRTLAGGIALLLVALAAVNFPFPGKGDRTAACNTHAMVLERAGRASEAIADWQESAVCHGTFSAYAELALAARLARAGDPQAALERLRRVPDTSFAASDRDSLRGDILASDGRLRAAADAYRAALARNSGRLETRARLVQVLQRLGDPAAYQEYEELLRIRQLYDASLLGPGSRNPGGTP